MRSRKVSPPDGGYGWVVVASAFLTMGLTAGVMKNIGLFFLDIQQHFGVLTSTTSWITSTTIAMFHLAAPVASALSMRFSQRVVIMAGGLLAASGMLLASLDLSLPWMYLSVGILQGTGIAFSWIPANSMVSHYFLHWRPFAYALASSGECVFAIMFSPFFQWLIDAYTWQGALLFIGGLQLHLCVCGALMRPLEAPARGEDLETKDDLLDHHAPGSAPEAAPEETVIFHWSLLRKRELLLYIAFAILAAAGFFIPPLFLVPFAASLDMGHYGAASVLSALAFADLVGRLACGWLANMRLMRNLQLLTMVVTMQGVVLLLLPVGRSAWYLLAFSSLYGFLFGCVVAVHVTAIVDIVGLERFDSGLGLFMLFRSIGGFVGPPAAGWLVDQTADYGAAFYFSGICLVCSALFVLLTDLLIKKRQVGRTEGAADAAPSAEYTKTPTSDEKSGMEGSACSVKEDENHVT